MDDKKKQQIAKCEQEREQFFKWFDTNTIWYSIIEALQEEGYKVNFDNARLVWLSMLEGSLSIEVEIRDNDSLREQLERS